MFEKQINIKTKTDIEQIGSLLGATLNGFIDIETVFEFAENDIYLEKVYPFSLVLLAAPKN
ncbi:MAG: hypothetical protein MJA82_11050 [Clostridia bacterium]|nr:hypothetical protein [Clostridia bacterium]